MRALPLVVTHGCTLSSDGLADQFERAQRLRSWVTRVVRSEDDLRVSFAKGVDRALVDEVVATEQQCCSFLEIEYVGATRMLRVGSHDAQGRGIVRQLADYFGEESMIELTAKDFKSDQAERGAIEAML